jgi:uncharacterized protein YciI
MRNMMARCATSIAQWFDRACHQNFTGCRWHDEGLRGAMTEERNPKETGMRDVPKNLKPYFLGLLRRGPRWNEIEGAEAAELLPRHLAYLREQSEAGRYMAAGPVLDESELAGVLLLAAESLETAVALAKNDPGVRAGRLAVEVHPVLLPALDGVRAVYSAMSVEE